MLAAAIAACTSDCLFHAYQPVPNMELNRQDTLCFDLPQSPADGTYAMTVGLRVGNRFAYQQLALVVESRHPKSDAAHRDTILFQLADSKGRLQGAGTTLYQYESAPLPLPLRSDQSTQLRVYHIMQHEAISAVSDIGIRITK